jgi:vacuolar-type H+-ATPase subunit I/STV1
MNMPETTEEKNGRLNLLATEINTIKSQTQKIMMQASVEIGKRLLEAKAAVGHGNWEGWLTANVDYSQRTASNLIRIYEEYGVGQRKLFGKEANPQVLASLTYTQAVALLGIRDADERAEFIDGHDVADMSSRDLQQAIKERDKAKAKNELLEKTKKKNLEKIEELQKQLNEAREKGEDEESSSDDNRVHELEVQLAVAKGRAEEAEKKVEEMEKAPLEPAVVERVPADVQAELDKLRADIAAAKNQPVLDPEQQKLRASFAVHIDVFQEEFNRINEFVEQMGDDRSKYELAFQKLIGIMMEQLTGGEN